jgi:hypothetical protein
MQFGRELLNSSLTSVILVGFVVNYFLLCALCCFARDNLAPFLHLPLAGSSTPKFSPMPLMSVSIRDALIQSAPHQHLHKLPFIVRRAS